MTIRVIKATMIATISNNGNDDNTIPNFARCK